MKKIVEIKPERKEEKEEDKNVKEEKEEAPIDFSDRVLVGDEIIIGETSPTLDSKIVNLTGFSSGGSLEKSLEDSSLEENVTTKKDNGFYDQDNSKYMGGNTFQSNNSLRRAEDIQGFGEFQKTGMVSDGIERQTDESPYNMLSTQEAEKSSNESIHLRKYETMR